MAMTARARLAEQLDVLQVRPGDRTDTPHGAQIADVVAVWPPTDDRSPVAS